MGFNFPTSPSVGAVFQPAGALGPTYKWDGEKWVGAQSQADGGVRYDVAQALTAAQMEQARKNITAAPIEAFNANLVVNPTFGVAQQYGGTNIPFTNGGQAYVVDQWSFMLSAPTLQTAVQLQATNPAPGFNQHIATSVSTPQASVGAADYWFWQQIIEAVRMYRLQWGTANARPVTLCFFAKSTQTGTYSGTLRTATGTAMAYAFEYTINAANTWEFKSINIPGPVGGDWSLGIAMSFGLVLGSNYKIAPNVWTSGGNPIGSTNQINWGAAANGFFLTGVTLIPGNEVPTSDRLPLMQREYPIETLLCQRYFNYLPDIRFAASLNGWLGCVTFPVMRIAPAVTFVNPSYTNGNTVTTNSVQGNSLTVQWTHTSPGNISYLVTGVLLNAR